MPLYEVTSAGLELHEAAKFVDLGLYERADLQRLLRSHIDALGDDLKVLAEEFGDWEDARRRIDLLAVDRSGRLVVIEIKRTNDGGHMELQAIRYAAMVSAMGFDEVVAAYERHCATYRPEDNVDARADLLAFLEPSYEGAAIISSDVRIVLVSADFGREVTTTVLWLNRFERMDIRCVRLVPYQVDGRVLLDIQQLIPLPEATDYQVRIRRKEVALERTRSDGRDLTKYHIVIDGLESPLMAKRNAVWTMVDALVANGVAPSEIRRVLPPTKMRRLASICSTPREVDVALFLDDNNVEVRRWFLEAWVEGDATFVLSKMWGLDTEPVLRSLSEAFPSVHVTFRSVSPDGATPSTDSLRS